jgi:hypothetical protein
MRRGRCLPWPEGDLEQQAVFGWQVVVVPAVAAVELAQDDARAPAAAGVMSSWPAGLCCCDLLRGVSRRV